MVLIFAKIIYSRLHYWTNYSIKSKLFYQNITLKHYFLSDFIKMLIFGFKFHHNSLKIAILPIIFASVAHLAGFTFKNHRKSITITVFGLQNRLQQGPHHVFPIALHLQQGPHNPLPKASQTVNRPQQAHTTTHTSPHHCASPFRSLRKAWVLEGVVVPESWAFRAHPFRNKAPSWTHAVVGISLEGNASKGAKAPSGGLCDRSRNPGGPCRPSRNCSTALLPKGKSAVGREAPEGLPDRRHDLLRKSC